MLGEHAVVAVSTNKADCLGSGYFGSVWKGNIACTVEIPFSNISFGLGHAKFFEYGLERPVAVKKFAHKHHFWREVHVTRYNILLPFPQFSPWLLVVELKIHCFVCLFFCFFVFSCFVLIRFFVLIFVSFLLF